MLRPDRIVELLRVSPRELHVVRRRPSSAHPAQQRALRQSLAQVGFAGTLVAWRRSDGSLELIDGHQRLRLALESSSREPASEEPRVPVLVIAVTETEARQLRARPASPAAGSRPRKKEQPRSPRAALGESYQLLVQCHDEQQQQLLYERLARDGMRVRVLTL
jgi:hypothetical protein